MRNGKHLWRTPLVVLLATLPAAFALPARAASYHDKLADPGDPKVCLTCHYGTMDKDENPCSKIDCLIRPGSSHPVFKRYPPAGKESAFAPAASVEAAGCRLIQGEVTCLSCHDLRNRQTHHLVMENKGGRLCQTCHLR